LLHEIVAATTNAKAKAPARVFFMIFHLTRELILLRYSERGYRQK
jgi:hypothetical protein